MIKHGQPMSQVLAQMQVNELKMNDPKLNKIFDKLKPKMTVQIKKSSTIKQDKDFSTYLVVSKNTLRNGTEKITLKNRANPTGVKSFLYRRDGKVTFAIGDMGASIDDIKEKYSLINHEIVEDIEIEEIDEGAASDARRSMSKDRDLVRRGKDSADVDDTASDADKKSAMKNMVMQMRQALDVRGNKPIEFEDGKKQKVDSKILNMLLKAHGMIPKPRDKEQFVKTISKSYRDMLKVAKKLSTLKMDLDKDDEDTVMDVIKGLEKAVKTHQGQVATLKKDIKDENELDEGFSPKEIKMAIGIASDPRYKQGNYSGAVKQIEKIKKGLASHPQVAAVLKRQNENLDEAMKMTHAVLDPDANVLGFTSNEKDAVDMSKNNLRKVKGKVFPLSKPISQKKADMGIGKPLALALKDEVELGEKKDAGKSASGYDIFHKDFSSAMQHATAFAKKKGQPIKKDEIDNKVATGPKKPSKGKENSYNLETEKGKSWSIQVYNMDGKKYELNMYLTSSYVPEELTNEENEMTKSLKDTIVEMWSEAVSPAQQAAIAISKKEKEEQDEGNAFGAALQAAREKGDETFVVAGKTYKCEDYNEDGEVKETNKNDKSDDGDGMDAVQPKAVKKKFKDRKDKDIDNDGDVDDSDKFLHKRRKAVSKSINSQKESIERYHETKRGSLRDTVLQMWGEKHTPDHKEDEKNEKKSLTKEKKDGIKNNMTDTGKEMSTVEVDAKMPKIKETKNKV